MSGPIEQEPSHDTKGVTGSQLNPGGAVSDPDAGTPAGQELWPPGLEEAADNTVPLAPLLPALARTGTVVGKPRPGGNPPEETAASRAPAPIPVRGGLSRLMADPRRGAWLRRTAAAVVVGLPIAIAISLALGMAAAAVVVITDTLFSNRVSSVVPATARVTSAQRKTRIQLARLAPAGYLSVHTRRLPGTASILDHLVVGPRGVMSIDSQYWDKRLPVRHNQAGRLLFHGPFGQRERIDHARWEAEQAARLLSEALGQPIAVQPVMVIYGPHVPWAVHSISGVDVMGGPRLRKYIRRGIGAKRGLPRLDEREVALLHAAAAHVLPRAARTGPQLPSVR